MILPDIKLLLYAHDTEAPGHAVARVWWPTTLRGDEDVGLPWIVLLAFVRLTTHPTLTRNPLSVHQSREVIRTWLKFPHVKIIFPSPATLEKTWDLLEAAGRGGNLSTKAHMTALALDQHACVYSNNHDFARFPASKWKNPMGTFP